MSAKGKAAKTPILLVVKLTYENNAFCRRMILIAVEKMNLTNFQLLLRSVCVVKPDDVYDERSH